VVGWVGLILLLSVAPAKTWLQYSYLCTHMIQLEDMANSDRSTHEETDQANGLARRKESRRGLSDAVPEFTFDCTGIGSKDTFWERFLVFIGAMDDHGTNLDALCDSMGGGCSDVLVRCFADECFV